jgi:hypothetical protein
MSDASDRVKKWRENAKVRMIGAFGGKCGVCGYNKCKENLAFHHLDPTVKEFAPSGMIANPISWNKIVDELRKCICVCHNCHGEIHNGLTTIPENIVRFNEKYTDYKKLEKESEMDECPVCGNMKPNHMITCSNVCGAKRARKIEWDKYDLENMLKTMSEVQIADIVNVSLAAVRKRIKKLSLISTRLVAGI